jgi:hypothetical protein
MVQNTTIIVAVRSCSIACATYSTGWGKRRIIGPIQKKRYSLKSFFRRRPYRVCQGYRTPIASSKDLHNSIVVYPEVTNYNPLGARRVVRWFLHRPGFHTGKISYGEDELCFIFDKASDDPHINKTPGNELMIFALNPVYENRNCRSRSGSCFMMRKGKDRPLVHDLKDSIQVDGFSHQELAQVFNRREVFYSYDEFTMYSQYAALCGCTSVVIPERFSSREEWVSHHPVGKFGVAYGLDDLEHARATGEQLEEWFDKKEVESVKAVRRFVETTCSFFGVDSQ